ncbi:succinyl-diaminopimelate desuccinylase [Oecophyllibacter saccharovorans]|uniref:Succinyl-diaminopimelate desuccinylase n=1 Tax=Oecophyllibacter saccharovorans TaxID=2558360 RepID=A0A506UQ60_9PROT|nr:succinyl-diaminopimelate desuccinylase [Oecophyllibacter saccharovorans]TPW35454.1 succinyl-diaminopimelate desuccinylase [Oecophyllibacter saccharovorans]
MTAFTPAALTDPVPLLQGLLRCPSVTPKDAGALALVGQALETLGFTVTSLPFGPPEAPTPNLYARLGTARPFLCLAGHTDVVAPGPDWQHDPFSGHVEGGWIYGRGAADMKGGVAAFIAAAARRLRQGPLEGSLAFLLTGDEEGPARHGTRAVLRWMKEQGEKPDFCLLGEPTNPGQMGEMIKVGRRGSLNAVLKVPGVQGHVAYPHLADNPLHRLPALLTALTSSALDGGNQWFAPSSLQVTSIDTGNPVTNIIPAQVEIRLNIRFNNLHTGASLQKWLQEVAQAHAPGTEVAVSVSGEAFMTPAGREVALLGQAVEEVTGRRPVLDTGGGTSDARFITAMCPVAEFGLVGATMHKRDERISLASLEDLTRVTQLFMEQLGV